MLVKIIITTQNIGGDEQLVDELRKICDFVEEGLAIGQYINDENEDVCWAVNPPEATTMSEAPDEPEESDEPKRGCPNCGDTEHIYGRADVRWMPETRTWEIGEFEGGYDCTTCDWSGYIEETEARDA